MADSDASADWPGWVVDAAWLEVHLEDPNLRIVQVGGELFFRQMRIPGSVQVEYRDLVDANGAVMGMVAPAAQLEQLFSRLGIGPDTCVVTCDMSGGTDSARLVWTLAHMGHARVAMLNGGLWSWSLQGRRWESGTPRLPAPAAFRAQPDPDCLADLAHLRAILQGERSALLIDTRSPGEYQGDPFSGQGGHLDGAVHRNWLEAVESPQAPRLRPPEALEALFRSAGVTPEQEVVLYCRSAHRASHTWVVMRHLGYERVRLFDGSMLLWDLHGLPKTPGPAPRGG